MPDARAYLDWNASAPLRPEARAAMIEALDAVGNPSSVHAEGRAARAIVERARERVAMLCMARPEEVIFTSGATEGASTVIGQGWDAVLRTPLEHDCVENACLATGVAGEIELDAFEVAEAPTRGLACVTAACGETGRWTPYQVANDAAREAGWLTLTDATQVVGRRWFNFSEEPATAEADYAVMSSHKIGGPKGAGALLVRDGAPLAPLIHGGGQEARRRSGTLNVAAIAGFGAAAVEAAAQDWTPVETLRDAMEAALLDAAPDLIVAAGDEQRLPNTSCLIVPGWRGETQVMQLDLAGFAVSAGSACSSGKVGPSRVLKASGHGDEAAASAIRVSLGPTTTEGEVSRFIDAWTSLYRKRQRRAA